MHNLCFNLLTIDIMYNKYIDLLYLRKYCYYLLSIVHQILYLVIDNNNQSWSKIAVGCSYMFNTFF